MNRVSLNPGLVPRLADFELGLHKAMSFLHAGGRTFRVERVPLCYMSDFAHCSTETRKIVKDEHRSIYFLDNRKLFDQDRSCWSYDKSQLCRHCTASPVCAGLYEMDRFYSSDELCPIFIDPEEIARRVREPA